MGRGRRDRRAAGAVSPSVQPRVPLGVPGSGSRPGIMWSGGRAQGALLLVLFQVSHTVEHMLTDRAQGDLTSLFDKCPPPPSQSDVNAGSPSLGSNQRRTAARCCAHHTRELLNNLCQAHVLRFHSYSHR